MDSGIIFEHDTDVEEPMLFINIASGTNLAELRISLAEEMKSFEPHHDFQFVVKVGEKWIPVSRSTKSTIQAKNEVHIRNKRSFHQVTQD